MRLSYLPYNLELKHEFRISYHSRRSTPAVLIRLEQGGLYGYGEASLPPYLTENQESVLKFLKKVYLQDIFTLDDLRTALKAVDSIEEGNSPAKAAIDIALHDLLGKLLKKSCSEIYGINPISLPFTSFTIGLDTDSVIREKLKEAEPYKILKIKLGTDRDKEIIKLIRGETDKPLYVDANQAWNNFEYALEIISWLAENNIVLIEQPMLKNNLDGSMELKENSPLPIIADESFQRFNDLDKIMNAFHGVNIKLMKCTGISEAYLIIKRARELGLRIMMGCMTETSCAISAAIQLAPLIDYADLDGNLLIGNDPFLCRTEREGQLIMPAGYGIGVNLIGNLEFREL